MTALVLLLALRAAEPLDGSVRDITCFQIYAPYSPQLDIGSDMAIVYGTGDGFAPRADVWKARGYNVGMMTGISWGGYDSYYVVDGVFKADEVQTRKSGELRLHNANSTVGYNVPSPSYVEYIKRYIEPAIDWGISALFLEEPEFWADTGWSASFKKEWQRFYGEPWQEPDSSPDAQYRASKLKYELYFRALRDVFAHAKARASSNGRELECHVPTHSLVNYAQWRIVSPESHLIDIPELDGYIAQVWTGTARSRNMYRGVAKERTFETAYLEYGQMAAMVRPAGKKVWFLHDPIEDRPDYSWSNYKENYECTVIASLFWPEVFRYEVMPWPDRIFQGTYPKIDLDTKSGEREGIPASYATELLTVINALNDMQQSEVELTAGSTGIGIVLSDTMMFQRAAPTPSDPMLSSLYGLALPLLKAGVPVEIVQLENTPRPASLDRYRLLYLTYEHQKPLKQEYHEALATWVENGGVLALVDDGRDPYHHVREWWNDQGASNAVAYEDLLKSVDATDDVWNAPHAHGRGHVRAFAVSPSALAHEAEGAARVMEWTRALLALHGLELQTSGSLTIRRGPYVIAAVPDESERGEMGTLFEGRFIDLFDPELPIITRRELGEGERAFLYDVDYAVKNGGVPKVLAAAARVTDEIIDSNRFQFALHGPANTTCTARILIPVRPTSVEVEPGLLVAQEWDSASSTLMLTLENTGKPARITVRF